MAKYIAELAVDIFESYAREANSVELKFGVADIAMELDLAVPCGLIFNELVLGDEEMESVCPPILISESRSR